MPNFSIERTYDGLVAGVDEAGRGPWAGPVVAAAVILPHPLIPVLRNSLDDSKRLTRKNRAVLMRLLKRSADIGVGAASVSEIEQYNILVATHRAMLRAIQALHNTPNTVLIDGNRLPPDLLCPGEAVIKGDSISISIAAASIVAKVTRDKLMSALGARYPVYGWEQNAGYGTRQHQRGLSAHGITPHHRRTFKPINKILTQQDKTGTNIA